MNFVLPKLNTLVSKDMKGNSEDIRKYIHVVNGHAILINGIIIVVNLREYVKVECEITDENELNHLDTILEWMEGKSFTGDFWAELTNKYEVNLLNNGQFEIQTLNYSKTLIWEETFTVMENVMEMLISNLNRQPSITEVLGIPFDSLSKVTACFKKELKGFNLLVKPIAQDAHIMFQAHKKDYIFGIVPLDYNSANDIYAFVGVREYHESLTNAVLE